MVEIVRERSPGVNSILRGAERLVTPEVLH